LVLITLTLEPDGCAAGVLDVGVAAVAGDWGVVAVLAEATGPAAVLLLLLLQAVTAMVAASMETVVIADRVMRCIASCS
jgi:hypothetical protein